ncbi:iron ABC transporter permease [Amycolatopsis rubida]|uniref:Iron ABC transporter permease n=1 Tax=Amycolatopsis rubida TaxID=112413 RepID=A0ABX0C4E1_9PSEU|nr:iron ABC transporter permease [Amycolatopsis sp. M39]MYW96137.1 ABC transporter permease subunit [Amycolatopsis rubida]NEC61128.1 iron ABC transporter permease [Amycolatopsis rubida]
MLLGAAIAVPVVIFFARAFSDGGSGLTRLGRIPDLGKILWTTVLLAIGGTAIGAVIAVFLAVVATRVPARLRGVASVIPLLPLVIPPVAFVYGWIFILDPKVGYANVLLRKLPFLQGDSGPINIYSTAGILFVTSLEVSAIIFAFVHARLREINGSVEGAARVSGASPTRTFWTITFPLLRPSLVGGLVVTFLIQLGQFTAPLFLGVRGNIEVITTEIFRLREQYPIDYPLTAALGLPLLVFGIVAILVQRSVVGDQRKYITTSTGRGVDKRRSWPAGTIVVGYGILVVGLPIAAIALVAFSPFWNGDLGNLTFSTENFTTAFDDPFLPQSIINGLESSLIAALIVLALGFVGALALSGVVRAPGPVKRALDFIFIAPLAIPRALLGMVVLFVFIRPPFSLYGTLALYVIGYIFVALPFSMRSQYSSLIGVPFSLFEAARVCGSGPFRTIVGIALPVAFRGMLAAFTLAFSMLVNEVAVSLMVQAPGKQVVGTLLYSLQQGGEVPEIAVLALIMTAITAIVLTLTLSLGGRSSLENL